MVTFYEKSTMKVYVILTANLNNFYEYPENVK